MVVQAYAKINLVLNVYNETHNGYHNIESLMIPISLHDSIEIAKLKDGRETFVTCDSFELAGEKYNLVSKAVDVLRKHFGFTDNFRITIYKRIFISAGLGGGSADAAAVMKGIVKLLNLEVSDAQLIQMGLEVGSDVPFCLFNKPAVISGRGEKIAILNNLSKKYYFLIIKPKVSLSTKSVYEKFDELKETELMDISKTMAAYEQGEKELSKYLNNCLEQAAFELAPEVKILKETLKKENLNCVMMCGSGSSVFCLSENKRLLFKLMKKYDSLGYSVEFAKTI